MKSFLISVLVILMFSCHPDKNELVDTENLKFTTIDSGELFFKNIRQSSYRIEAFPEAGMNLFHAKSKLSLLPVLAQNWRFDQAYLIWEDSIIQNHTLHISLQPGDTLELNELTPKEQTLVIIQTYNALMSNHSVSFLLDQTPMNYSNDFSENFRKIVFDYLRLTGIR